MKMRLLLTVAVVGLLTLGSVQAGWNNCGPGGYRGGYYGPRYYGGGPGWGWGGGPSFGVSFVTAPQPVYRTVYVERGGYRSSGTLLATAQARLARMGYYRGYIDGDFGPQTARALRNYQIDYGLPVTGRLDGRTLSSLGI